MKSSEKKTSDKIDKMIEWAKGWIGTPYAFANSRSGIDCTRYMRRVFGHVGIKLPGGWPVPMCNATKAVKKFRIKKDASELKKLQKGDLIYSLDSKGKKGHAYMYIGNGKIIHSHPSKMNGRNGVYIQNYLKGKNCYRGSRSKIIVCRMFSDTGEAVGTGSQRSGVQIYLDEAKKHIGSKGKEWVRKNAPSFHPGAWCADTQCALMKVTGFAGKIGPKNNSLAGGFGQDVVEKYGGKYIKGPGYGGGLVIPKPGDFIELYGGGCSKQQPWSSGHIGVVEFVQDVKGKKIVHTIEGNSSDSYRRRTYSANSQSILWYARPKWSKVGGDDYGDNDEDTPDEGGTGLLYDSLSTNADATIREVSYADLSGEPNLKEDKLKLCVANYTTVLFWIVYAYGGTGGGGQDNDDDDSDSDGNWKFPKGMNSNAKFVFNYLAEKGLNKAAICGILGNMKKENTNFVPGLGTHHFGICQWSAGRYGDTKHTIKAECDLLWKELTHGYKGVLVSLKAVKNSESGCKSAAKVFCEKFEVCGNYSWEVPKRQEYGLDFYKKIEKDDSSSSQGDGKTSGKWMVPVKASYMVNAYGEYGARRSYEMHPGIDMASPIGTPIYAANGGTVILAQNWGGYGNCVRIKHSGGLVSLYGHGSKILVKKGQKVSKGDKILLMGSTGYSTGSHLHFQINKGEGTGYNTSINPRNYCKIHGIGTGK